MRAFVKKKKVFVLQYLLFCVSRQFFFCLPFCLWYWLALLSSNQMLSQHLLGAANGKEKKTKNIEALEALMELRSLLIKAGKSVLTVCICLSDCTSLWEGSYQLSICTVSIGGKRKRRIMQRGNWWNGERQQEKKRERIRERESWRGETDLM